MYDHRSAQNREKARKNLARLMPAAQVRAHELMAIGAPVAIAAVTGLEAAAAPYIHIRRFCGVHLYCVGAGQYHADIEMEGLPVGYPFVFGTPTTEPGVSLEDAEAWAIDTIAQYMLADRQGEDRTQAEANFAHFEIDGLTFAIPRKFIERTVGLGYWTEARASFHLEKQRRAMGGQLTQEGLAKMASYERRFLDIAMVSMLLAGTPRYPRRRPRAS
ncbi:hypothetical protein [Aminobacter sp. AP02]|uniref:hypothetical protein n=1 Tax=Aminobacter sp. AP02 TaxID=2135737 RepID=UPI000D7A6D8B|nr:hypothetical protein [Aminobacter sp. AP02]PWK59692.1 hypothetical protein C8K44_14310 [Aminobacter sp. AP02]